MSKQFTYIIYFFFVGLLCLTAFNFAFEVIEQDSLHGAYAEPRDVALEVSTWMDESFQASAQRQLRFFHPLKSSLVQIRNQVDYSLFNEAHFYSVMAGDEGYIFSQDWAETYAGKQNHQDAFYSDSIATLKWFQDFMKEKGGGFFVMIAPCKERLMADKLPSKYRTGERADYDLLKASFESNNINHIDFVEDFEKRQDTSKYWLFGKTSTHWTVYGATIAMTKMMNEINACSSTKVPEWGVEKYNIHGPNELDSDIEETMNLMFGIGGENYAYPKFFLPPNLDAIKRPKVLIISDSFYWAINNTYIPNQVLSPESKFLYYFSTCYNYDDSPSKPVSEMDIVSEIKSADAVVMLVGSENTNEFPYSFIDYVLEHKAELEK
ncbi:hypothetical protein N9M27_04800 [Flavobacteriales bacterium]|nr:hypothetical protein [Flavobacteriales bacterium]